MSSVTNENIVVAPSTAGLSGASPKTSPSAVSSGSTTVTPSATSIAPSEAMLPSDSTSDPGSTSTACDDVSRMLYATVMSVGLSVLPLPTLIPEPPTTVLNKATTPYDTL